MERDSGDRWAVSRCGRLAAAADLLAGDGQEAIDLAVLVAQRLHLEQDVEPTSIRTLEGKLDAADAAFEEVLGDEIDDLELDAGAFEEAGDGLVDGLVERDSSQAFEGLVRPFDDARQVADDPGERFAAHAAASRVCVRSWRCPPSRAS